MSDRKPIARIRWLNAALFCTAITFCSGCMMKGVTYRFPPPSSVIIGSERGDDLGPTTRPNVALATP